MADTIRTPAYLTASVYQDGQAPGSISEQDHRDFVVSASAWVAPAFVTLTERQRERSRPAPPLTSPYRIVPMRGCGTPATAAQ